MIEHDAFSSEEEIKRDLQVADGNHGGGPFLYMDWASGDPLVAAGESNGILLGVTGCGKTRRGTIPMTMSMIQANESVVTVDSKGDLLKYTYALAKAKGYYVKVFDFRDLTKGDGFDMFGYAFENYKSPIASDRELAVNIIKNIGDCIYGEDKTISGRRDPFWDSSAKSLFMALMYMLFDFGQPDQIHPAALIRLANDCFKRQGATRNVDRICELYPKSAFVPLLGNVRSAPSENTLPSIKSSFFQPLNIFLMSDTVKAMLSDASFKMSELDGQKKVAIYIILPDENTNYSALASIILTQIVSHHFRIAHTKYNGSLPRRLNVVIEELGNIGASLPMLPSLMTAGRSRNIRTFFVLQSFSQLETIYGKSKAATIRGNADTLVAYRVEEMDTLRELSAKCGEAYNEETGMMEPIVTPTQLGSLDTGEILVLKSGRLKYITQLPDFTELLTCKRIPEPDHVPSRALVKSDLPSLEKWVMDKMSKDMEEKTKKASEDAARRSSGAATDPFASLFSPGFSFPHSGDYSYDIMKSTALAAKHEREYQEARSVFGQMLGKAVHQVAERKFKELMDDVDRRLRELDEWENKLKEGEDPEKPCTDPEPEVKSQAETPVKKPRKKPVKKDPAKKEAAKKAPARKPASRKTASPKDPDGPASEEIKKFGLLITYEIKSLEEQRVFFTFCRHSSTSEPMYFSDRKIEVFFSSIEDLSAFSIELNKITSGVRSMTLRRY